MKTQHKLFRFIQLKLNLRLILILTVLFSLIACNAKDGFLDTLDLGNVTIDELSEKVKDKENIEIKRYKNVNLGENLEVELGEDETSNDACNCKTIDYIETIDPTIANYKGVLGKWANLTAYDSKIVEYQVDIAGVDNINKILDLVYAEHPDIKLMDDGTNRLKKYINKNTVLQVWVNTVMQNNLFVTISYTINAEATRFWLYPNYDDEIIENVNRISLEKDEKGHYGVIKHYIDK